MDFTKVDLVHAENLIRALKKAKFDLDGMEVLAFAELFKWVNKLFYGIQKEVQEKEVGRPDLVVKEPKDKIEGLSKPVTPKGSPKAAKAKRK